MEKKIRGIMSNRKNPGLWVLLQSLFLSLVALVVIIAETDYSDRTLFFLLAVLRYSSFLVFTCSVYLLINGIARVFRQPSPRAFVWIFLFMMSTLYGACIIVIDALIISVTGGNR